MYRKVIKKLLDLILALILVILLSPLMIIIAIMIKIDSKGPVIFKQIRSGKNNKNFTLYKFRSMIYNNNLYDTSVEDQVTKIGRILRKTSLDEIPQFINVLKGDMSLIGNRPYLPREKKDMGNYIDEIVKTKPGITGYWQVNGRSNTTFEERLKLEEYYSSHANIWLDIKILFKTVYVVLFHKGAE